MAKKEVIIYSTPVCPYCNMAKEFLKEHDIPFTDHDVSVDREKAEEMVRKSGQTGVPVIEIEGEIIIGFDLARLKKALGIKE